MAANPPRVLLKTFLKTFLSRITDDGLISTSIGIDEVFEKLVAPNCTLNPPADFIFLSDVPIPYAMPEVEIRV